MNNISRTAEKISNKLRTITIILNFGQIEDPIFDTFSACIVHSCVLKQTELYRPLLYNYWDNISTPTSGMPSRGRIPLRYSVTTKINECPSGHIRSSWFVWCIGGMRSFSAQTSSLYPHGWYINSNLGYVICSKYTFAITHLEQDQFPRQNRFFDFIVLFICARERFCD